MADYRLSAQVISRAKGQSSIAAAAYRAAVRLDDPRTGATHDFTRKSGVVFADIIAPDDAPEWMRDRAKLWQAVETAERRKDAQLAREVQLSLPHELTPDQRQALLVGFVREQFVSHGMIADVALHSPGREGDDRNHHAHVMLTMRSLTGDGFGNKVRDWNDPATLARWREAWALHQNRELERYGHAARVDHRSFADQGVDREPSQHLGPTAADMERNGKPSRIGDENRTRSFNNAARATVYRQHWSVEEQRQQFEVWARRRTAAITQQSAKRLESDTRVIEARHGQERGQLEDRMRRQYGTHKATIGREVEAVDRRLQAKGAIKFLRDVFGRSRADIAARQDLARTLRAIQEREADKRRHLERQQRAEIDRARHQAADQERRRLAGIERRRDEREREGWLPAPANAPARKPVQQAFNDAARKGDTTPPTPPASPPARQGWRSDALTDRRPWESDITRLRSSTRERRPTDEPPEPKKE